MHRVAVLGPRAGVLACDVHGPEQELLLVRRVPLCAAALVLLTNPTVAGSAGSKSNVGRCHTVLPCVAVVQ